MSREMRVSCYGQLWICGQRAGSKKRGEMLQDYLAIIGEQAALETGIIAAIEGIQQINNAS